MEAILKIPFLLVTMLVGGGLAQAQTTDQTTPAQPSQPASEQQSDDIELSTDRPGFLTSTDVVPKGHIQLESGIMAERSGDDRSYSFGQLLVRVPVSSRAEARVGVPSYLVSRSGGMRDTGADNVFLEGKYLLASRKNASYAILVNAFLPTGSRRVTTREFQPGVNLAADYTFCDKVGATFNVGAVRTADDDSATGSTSHSTQLFGAASFNFTLSPKTGAFAELYAEGGDGPTQKYVDGGFTYLLNPRTQLDASAGVGLGNDAGGPDYFYAVGVSRLF
ncbi:hypothetical protein IAD21_03972 [Abditibacteriota bacterium]|nr:hypothetical protein IAD21_03972 [Abditibacteriota bacterium]